MRKLDDETRKRIERVIDRHRSTLEAIPGFVHAEAGFPIVHGWVVKSPAIVVYVEQKKPASAVLTDERIPRFIGDVRVDVVQADPRRQLAWRKETAPIAASFDAAAAAGALTYKRLPENPIDQAFEVEKPLVCHVGPDAGWPVLKRYLEGTRDTLSVAMYDFNADWVVKTFIETVKDNAVDVVLTWDNGMTSDETAIRKKLKASLGSKLDAWIVECGSGRRFASAYHEKVAVRDKTSFWLSSGNWSKRSQPDIDPVEDPDSAKGMYSKGNREWHVIVNDAPLAALFERYIRYDRDKSEEEDTALDVAARVAMPDVLVPIETLAADAAALAVPKPVAPKSLPDPPRKVRVRPLLTPDNYVERVTDLIRTAKQSIYLQYAYITYSKAPEDRKFREMLDLLGDRTNEKDFDVKIIVGSSGADEKVPKLVEAGFNDASIRVQSSIHNKGIVVDGEIVLVSSANWSGDGVLRNRDAGLLIYDADIAKYYQDVFVSDWNERARQSLGAATGVRLAVADEPTPPGMVRMTWDDYYGE